LCNLHFQYYTCISFLFLFISFSYLQVDPRILKAVAIEHHNDVDSAVVAILDEVMPSVTSTSPPTVSSVRQEIAPCCIATSSASDGTSETGDSSSAGKYVMLYLA
jgi:hypothetical protein